MTIRKFKPISAKFITGVAMLALMAGASLALSPQAFAEDCLLDSDDSGDANAGDTDGGADSSGDNLRLACGVGASAAGINSTALGNGASAAGPDSTAMGREASAAGTRSIALGRNAVATETDSIALGNSANAGGTRSTALGRSADAAGVNSTAVGSSTSAGGTESTALGRTANAAGERSIALGFSADAGVRSIALGGFSNAGERATSVGYGSDTGLNAVALGGDSTADIDTVGAQALGDNSIAIGADASDGSFADAVIIGKGATATEADQVILKSADTFTIMGNGDVGIGTAAPMGNLDINSGVDDTVLLLTNTSAQWELKSKAATGRLNFKNLTDGGVPFKLGPSAVNALLSVGTAADDLVEVRGELMVEGDVDVTGTLTTGGPTLRRRVRRGVWRGLRSAVYRGTRGGDVH